MIEKINILFIGTRKIASIDDIAPIINGVLFLLFLYCSIAKTINKEVKENSKPFVLKDTNVPNKAPNSVPIIQ